jgi:bile acid:Na+ symporter, BASS family
MVSTKLDEARSGTTEYTQNKKGKNMDILATASIDEVMLNFSPTSLQILNAVLAIVMFSIAIDLMPDDFKRLARAPKSMLTGLFSQYIILPALTFCMILVTTPQPSIALGLILVAACPGGNISNFITHRAGGNAALSVSMTAFSTVGAILLTPLNIAFWGNLYGPTRAILQKTSIDPVSVAITVGFMLVLPLGLGVLLNIKRPDITTRLRAPLQYLSMGIFVAFVVLALAANWALFLQFAGAVAGLVILHNALALSGGFATASLVGLSSFDRRAVMIETGIQNSGLGLILIFGFFSGLGGMAVVAAFWGIWHLISGMALAGILARTPAAR